MQGDGNAFIFQDDPAVFTFSIHGEGNFPVRKQSSDLDIPLPDGASDDVYLRVLGEVLPSVLAGFGPDIVLYDAGVDTHMHDSLGKLNLTDTGLRRRELQVLDTCLAADIPVAGYVGGGYSPDLTVLARRHCQLHRAAKQMWEDYELGQRSGP